MENRDFKGVWIPKEIYLNKELSWSEKILLIEIDSLDNDEEKGCFASNKYFSEFIGIGESSMANMISKLKSKNYIFQVFFDGRNRGLRLHKNIKSGFIKQVESSQEHEVRVHKNVKSDLTKIVIQTTQKSEHNNTINNTTNKQEIVSSESGILPYKNEKPILKNTIENRKLEFQKKLEPFLEKYNREMLVKFSAYWCEKNKSETKMKFELEKTFEISLRLTNWATRDKDFTPAKPENTIKYGITTFKK